MVTNFGKFADPLADKMLTMTAFIYLVDLKLAPAWVVAIIVCRELAVTGLRLILAENKGQVLAAKMPGKIKTTCQMLSIIFLLIGNFWYIGTILLYLALIFTITLVMITSINHGAFSKALCRSILEKRRFASFFICKEKTMTFCVINIE